MRAINSFKMTYDWEPYKDTCYRLYVEEKKSLRELLKILNEEHNFSPRYVDRTAVWLAVSRPPALHKVGMPSKLHPPLWLAVQPARQARPLRSVHCWT